MRVLYYDCFAGISGDMNLAAMLDLGISEDLLRDELAKLNLAEEFELITGSASKNGIFGTRVDVRLHHHHHHHHHHHDNAENHHHHPHPEHTHKPTGEAKGHHHAPHRNLADITAIINNSKLDSGIKTTALNIFKRIAEAEAKVHACDINAIHFHEVGATDAIVDIVGAAICRHNLNIERVICGPIQLGSGFVKCAHGTMPVPAPATVEILKGIPTLAGGVNHEATTPTGAAILAEIVDKFVATPELVFEQCAYGIGHRDTGEIPNILRVCLAEQSPAAQTCPAAILECSVDDMTGEELGYAMQKIFEAGADDVNFIPIIMKKSRPATLISVLCEPTHTEKVKQAIFRHTSTLGIKAMAADKTVLERRETTTQTPWGSVRIKEALLDGKVIRRKPEYEECAAIAAREDVPLSTVRDAALTGNPGE